MSDKKFTVDLSDGCLEYMSIRNQQSFANLLKAICREEHQSPSRAKARMEAGCLYVEFSTGLVVEVHQNFKHTVLRGGPIAVGHLDGGQGGYHAAHGDFRMKAY